MSRPGGYGVLALAVAAGLVVLLARYRAQTRLAAAMAERQRRLAGELIATEDRERRALAERLHDGAIQDLHVARQELAEVEAGDPRARARLFAAVDASLRELRAMISDLHPAVLERGGLARAIDVLARRQAERTGCEIAVTVEDAAAGRADRLVYGTVRELLSNVAKHAGAAHVTVHVGVAGAGVDVAVADDGRGMDAAARAAALAAGHIGLASLQRRIAAIGGELVIASAPGEGTRVRARIPST